MMCIAQSLVAGKKLYRARSLHPLKPQRRKERWSYFETMSGRKSVILASCNWYACLLILLFVTCSLPAAQRVLVVVGAPGSADYAAQYSEWAAQWEKACHTGGAVYEVIGLGEPGAVADREALKQRLSEYTSESPQSVLWMVLIGHGTYDSRTAKFNLRGPDVSAHDLDQWLTPIKVPVVLINTASSSAPFLTTLGGPQRIVLTATKSGFEHNLTRFGQYLAAAIGDPGADLDKDGQTSLLEAFLSASYAVNEFYQAAGRLVTEHALLDDNGDALGTPADWFRGIRPTKKATENASLDGYRAHQLHLIPSATEARMSPELRARRDHLELQIMHVRDERNKLSEADYYSQLEALLYEIGQVYEKAEDGGRKAEDRGRKTED